MVLKLTNLRKEFSSSVVPVKDISLEVKDGEFLTLLGPSGCGKSTLLRLIAGLEQPTQGKVIIAGKDVTSIPPGKRNISMVFQSYALYPHLSVFENISAALKLRKVPKEEIERRVHDVTQRLGLEHLLTRKPGQLSGGQRQRVALARSLVRNPDIFLLDEPLSNLDALLREQVRADLKQLFESQNKPVVYVTHDQIEAMTLSDKIAVLSEGYLQQLASPHEIYSAPASKFIAGFVGSPQMNFLTLDCEENTAILGDSKITLPQLLTQIDRVVLGIRPEHISVRSTEAGQKISGTLFLVEDFGKEKLLTVRIKGCDEILRVMVPSEQSLEGENITLSLPKKQLHWFDIETGNRLN